MTDETATLLDEQGRRNRARQDAEVCERLERAEQQRDRLLEAARTLIPYTQGFSESRTVAEAKETIEQVEGERDA